MKQSIMESIEPATLPSYINACIAITSWKARINTVGLTIYNLINICGNHYHVVLTLAEDEFPLKERELPKDLLAFIQAGVLEILWVKHNWKSFKKWVFCGLRYPDIPIITADDDCIYNCNYADRLYNFWTYNKSCIITNDCIDKGDLRWPRGPNTLYPNLHKVDYSSLVYNYFNQHFDFIDEDMCFGILAQKLNIPIIELGDPSYYEFHSQIEPQFNTFKWNYLTVRSQTEQFVQMFLSK